MNRGGASVAADDAWTPEDGIVRARLALRVCAWLVLVFVLIFTLAPQLDIRFSALFFDAGASPPIFPLDHARWMVHLTRITLFVANATLAVAVGWMLLELLRASRRRLQVIIVALSLAIGPGLVINSVIKPFWDRARPRDATVFGGVQPYTPVHVLPGGCDRNCSFPSGHGGAGFAPLVGIFVTRGRRWLWYGLACGALIGCTRLISGAHWLSDILASGIIVVAVSSVVTLVVIRFAVPPHEKRRR